MTEVIEGLGRIVGQQHIITDKQQSTIYTEEQRGRYASDCLAVVLPETTEEVSGIVRFCGQQNLTLVPQGGNTGAMGGAVANKDQLIVNLKRLNKIIKVDAADYTMTVQAGCILAHIQEAAKRHDRLFPLSLGSQGSCQIGGNLATNAGGINVLHYGNARDLVLGIEVVLANGKIFHGLNALRKNNTGYDLKNLFIGSEGTLGIITAAVLKLFPYPKGQIVALIGLESIDAGVALLSRLKCASSDRLTTFELMSQIAVETAVKHIHGQANPFDKPHPWYILAVAHSSEQDSQLAHQIESALATALEDGLIKDAVIAQNHTQAQRLILLREDIVEAQKFLGGSIKHDVSVPVSKVSEFMAHAYRAVKAFMPNALPYPYGHLGDGNIHFNISQPADMDKEKFLENWKAINTLLHDITHDCQGSFSAEHGIGISKLDEMDKYKDPTEMALYRQIKKLLDPKGLLNPGKMLR
ncbi:FAD-binding oxidoreductase [Candidatus Spongiihabitans sp.]|uniref:FAD-binding oxidoreductase n=1 Tax=Candidatus Spongiihabitans sp. TaxID=3101308 RepID=UPI003C7E89BF